MNLLTYFLELFYLVVFIASFLLAYLGSKGNKVFKITISLLLGLFWPIVAGGIVLTAFYSLNKSKKDV